MSVFTYQCGKGSFGSERMARKLSSVTPLGMTDAVLSDGTGLNAADTM